MISPCLLESQFVAYLFVLAIQQMFLESLQYKNTILGIRDLVGNIDGV